MFFLLIGLLLGVFGFNNIIPLANKDFFFQFPYNASTEKERKFTTSSVYIRAYETLGGDAFSAYVKANNARTGPSKAVYLNQDVYLQNYAVETYGSGVRVEVQGESSTDGVRYASGRWRPDL